MYNCNFSVTSIVNLCASELEDALTLSEQTKTNLESELRVFESNVEKLNQQVAGAENKISQVTAQKEKLVGSLSFHSINIEILKQRPLILRLVFRNLILRIW